MTISGAASVVVQLCWVVTLVSDEATGLTDTHNNNARDNRF